MPIPIRETYLDLYEQTVTLPRGAQGFSAKDSVLFSVSMVWWLLEDSDLGDAVHDPVERTFYVALTGQDIPSEIGGKIPWYVASTFGGLHVFEYAEECP